MSEVGYLIQQAERCRRLADGITDRQVIERLLQLADDFERRAAEISAPINEIPPPISH
jgi:hypothetical protein